LKIPCPPNYRSDGRVNKVSFCRISSSAMWRRVALVRKYVSYERVASIIMVNLIISFPSQQTSVPSYY
jgi:hypothetical protein